VIFSWFSSVLPSIYRNVIYDSFSPNFEISDWLKFYQGIIGMIVMRLIYPEVPASNSRTCCSEILYGFLRPEEP
jgi:hypothetical protein